MASPEKMMPVISGFQFSTSDILETRCWRLQTGDASRLAAHAINVSFRGPIPSHTLTPSETLHLHRPGVLDRNLVKNHFFASNSAIFFIMFSTCVSASATADFKIGA